LQLVGYWLQSTESHRQTALPVSFGSISFEGPTPPAGSLLDVLARIDSIDQDEIHCGIQFSFGGQVWAQLENCILKRFESEALLVRPARHFFAERQPEGWVVAVDAWSDAITPMLIANQALGTGGYAQYERQPLRGRRQWLLGRLAVKDAVRQQLRQVGVEDVFPIEVGVTDGPDGQPLVHGWAERPLPRYHVSVAWAGKITVAMARTTSADEQEGGPGVGISVARADPAVVGARRPSLSADEHAILELLAAGSGKQENLWLARFLASKAAVAKASGPTGDDAACVITGAEQGWLSISAACRRYQVGYREFEDPGETPPGQYVVAWTWGPGRIINYQGSEEQHESFSHEL
jgi:hypothetical protein